MELRVIYPNDIKDNARKWICFFTFHIICEHDYGQIHSILAFVGCRRHEIRQMYKEEDPSEKF
jgi:hypothetical protein